MNYTCPHCEKIVPVPEVVIANCEAYGGRVYKITCSKCKGPNLVDLGRIVKLYDVCKGFFKTDDWGEPTNF